MRLDTARVGSSAKGLSALLKAASYTAPLVLLMAVSPAQAQRDDPGLQLNCANDFFRLCAGVDPQSSQADACMNRNRSRLSSECKAAIGTYENGTASKRGRSVQ